MNRFFSPRFAISVLAAVATSVAVNVEAFAQPQWTIHGSVIAGGQLDAVRGPNDRVHVIAAEYAQIDSNGTVLLTEPASDERQGNLDFPPAIAVGSDGSVHVVTRHGGDWTSGHDIRYRRRSPAGTWDRDYWIGTPATRNYVVGVAATGPDQIYAHVTEGGTNVWGDVHLWQAGASSAQALGSLSAIWRSDCDARMRGRTGRVVLVSGEPDPDGTAYVLFGNAGASVRDDLAANQHEHRSGAGRRGFADLYVDESDGVHVTYGAEHEVYYNRYSLAGQAALSSDVRVFDDLGDWHLSTGLSAVAASDDGAVVLAVALRADGSQQAADSDLLWSYSVDGGQSWSPPEDLGRNTHGGEGRRRPRLVAVGHTFLLLFGENGVSGISLATISIVVDEDEDGYGANEDCNDQNPDVYPGAPELCNGEDDDCDGDTDEGCPCEPGSEQPCGTDVGECQQGTQTCVAQQWGPCEGAVEPRDEICDGRDNDCDGATDEQCTDAPTETPSSPDSDGGCDCVTAPRPRNEVRGLLVVLVALAGGLVRRGQRAPLQ